jgi:phage terminase Nu1 subunit (DNA packaging protein)
VTGRLVVFPARERDGRAWEPWVDEPTIARHFGAVSTRTIRRWRKQGMPSRMNGGRRQYRISECEAWHDARERAAS